MILRSPRSAGYKTWLRLASSIDTTALELACTNPDGSRETLYIVSGDTYVLPDKGLILGFHVNYSDGSSEFVALDHSGAPDWHEKRAAMKEAAHFVWDAVSVGKMILARTRQARRLRTAAHGDRQDDQGGRLVEATIWSGVRERIEALADKDRTWDVLGAWDQHGTTGHHFWLAPPLSES